MFQLLHRITMYLAHIPTLSIDVVACPGLMRVESQPARSAKRGAPAFKEPACGVGYQGCGYIRRAGTRVSIGRNMGIQEKSPVFPGVMFCFSKGI